MIRAGLTSVTFRKLSPDEIVRWAVEARLDGIEWGGDVHVPHGEIDTARRVAAMTREAGLVVSSYGSYYRVGDDNEPHLFAPVLETALALGAPIIRVWAGRVASSEADEAYRAGVAADARRITEAAHASGIRIVTEWHGNTLTDTPESAEAFFEAVDHPDLGTYWQARSRGGVDDCLRELDAALPRLAGLHVFYRDPESGRKLPLAEGPGLWRACLSRAAKAGDLFALLEFVIDEDPQQMLRDAAALRAWLGEIDEA